MSTIFARPGRQAHPEQVLDPDEAARQRRDRLARATVDDMESALAFLSMIDPEAFEIAFTAARPRAHEFAADTAIARDAGHRGDVGDVRPAGDGATAGNVGTTGDAAIVGDAGAAEDEEPLPACRECGALVGIFLNHGLRWQHFRGDAATSGTQEIYAPGHPAKVAWLLPGEDPEDLL